MPIYEYELPDGSIVEAIRPYQDREAILPGFSGARVLPSASYFRPESLLRDHPVTGKRMVYNDFDDPWAGTKGEGWAREASRDFSAKVDEENVKAGLADEKASFERKRMVFA